MKIKVLGSSGSEGPGRNSPAFLIDDVLLVDAGTVSLSLDRDAQSKISHILLSHAHLDHIKGIPALVDNLAAEEQERFLTIMSGREVLDDLRRNIFNNKIWPDFSKIPSPEAPVMRYASLGTHDPAMAGSYRVHATPVNHPVPAYGFMIESPDGKCLVYSGDTGPTRMIWDRMRGHRVNVLIIETSFPDSMVDLALATGHLTPSLLLEELHKMPDIPERIYLTHMKPLYRLAIQDQVAAWNGFHVQVMEDDSVIAV